MRKTYDSGIYCIIDVKTGEPVGQFLQLHRHENVAVRTFAEIATDERGQIHRWPDDYELVRVGYIVKEEDGTHHPHILPEYKTIMSARTVLDAQNPNANQERPE